YRVNGKASSVRMAAYCDGWYKAVVPGTNGAQVKLVFEVGGKWDSNGLVNGQHRGYFGSGKVLAVTAGKLSSSAPSCPVVSDSVVYYKPTVTLGVTPTLWYRVNGKASSVRMAAYCDGWYKAVVPGTNGAQVKLVFEVGGKWDSNGLVNGQHRGYFGSGKVLAVTAGKLSSSAPSCPSLSSTTVWYQPSRVSLRSPVLWYRVNGKASSVQMTAACGGWYKAVVPAANGAQVKLVFEVDGTWDSNGLVNGQHKGYFGAGDNLAVSNGTLIANVTPGCKVL
ncbi:hypothetical protein, partial [Bifidobacterium pseudolongum]